MAKLLLSIRRERDQALRQSSNVQQHRGHEEPEQQEASFSGSTWVEYAFWLWNMSKLRKLWSNEVPNKKDVARIMNAASVVDVIVIVMSLSICATLSKNYMKGYYQTCDTDMNWMDIKDNLVYPLIISAFCGQYSLLITMMYQFLAPITNASFHIWWNRVKFIFYSAIVATIVGTVCYLVFVFAEWYAIMTGNTCLKQQFDEKHYVKVFFSIVAIACVSLRTRFSTPFFTTLSVVLLGGYTVVALSSASVAAFGDVITLLFTILVGLIIYVNITPLKTVIANLG